MKRAGYLASALVITVLALVYALWGVDYPELGRLVSSADYRVLLPFAVFLVLFYLVTGLRWNLILRPLGRFSLRQTGPAMMIGFAGNNVLPAHLGELVRAVVFGRLFALPASGVLMTLIVERLLDVFAILFFYFLAVALIDPFPESIRLGAELIAGAMAAVCAVIVLFLRFPAVFVRLWEGLAHWLPVRVRRRGGQLLENAATALSALKSPGMLLVMLAYSLLKWLSSGAIVWLSLLAFDTRISLPVSMIVIAVSAVALTVPSAPGFFGSMQAAYVFALLPFGVSREIALAASVLALVFQWLTVTLFGGVCFAATGLRYREVRAQAEQVRG